MMRCRSAWAAAVAVALLAAAASPAAAQQARVQVATPRKAVRRVYRGAQVEVSINWLLLLRQQHGCGSGCSAQHSVCLEQSSNDSKPSCHPLAAAAPPTAASSTPAEPAPATSSSSSQPAAAQPQVPREHCPVGGLWACLPLGHGLVGGVALLSMLTGYPEPQPADMPPDAQSSLLCAAPLICSHTHTHTHAVSSAACSQAPAALSAAAKPLPTSTQPSSSTAAAVAIPAAVAFPAAPLTPTSQPKVR